MNHNGQHQPTHQQTASHYVWLLNKLREIVRLDRPTTFVIHWTGKQFEVGQVAPKGRSEVTH